MPNTNEDMMKCTEVVFYFAKIEFSNIIYYYCNDEEISKLIEDNFEQTGRVLEDISYEFETPEEMGLYLAYGNYVGPKSLYDDDYPGFICEQIMKIGDFDITLEAFGITNFDEAMALIFGGLKEVEKVKDHNKETEEKILGFE